MRSSRSSIEIPSLCAIGTPAHEARMLRGAVAALLMLVALIAPGCGGGGGTGVPAGPGGGTGGGGGGGAAGTTTLISHVDHLPASAYERSIGRTNALGEATVFSDELGASVTVRVMDASGGSASGLDVHFSFLNDRMMAGFTDPLGVYAPSFVQVDLHDQLASSKPQYIVVTLAAVLTVVKIASVLYTAYELHKGLHEIYDWHVDHIEDFSLATTTYRSTVRELGEVLVQLGDTGVSAILLHKSIVSGLPKEATKKVAIEFIEDEVTDLIVQQVIHDQLQAMADEYGQTVGPDTEVFLKVHHLGALMPLYTRAFEVIPVFGSAATGSGLELLGEWAGNWNNFTVGASGDLRLIIDTASRGALQGRMWDLEYSSTISVPFTGTYSGTSVQFGFEDPDDPARRFTVSGQAIAGSMTLEWTSTYGEDGSVEAAKGP